MSQSVQLKKQIENYLINTLINIGEISPGDISNDVNFLEMGVASSKLIEISSNIERDFDIELYPTLFFEYQNLNDLSNYFIEEHKGALAVYFKSDTKTVFEKPSLKSKYQMTEPRTMQSQILKTPKEQKVFERLEPLSLVQPIKTPVSDDVAIIGMHGYFAESRNLDEFWENISNQVDLIKEIPLDHFDFRPWYHPTPGTPDRQYSKWGSFITDVDKFDASFFRISRREAELMDPQLRLSLQAMYSAAEDAGYAAKLKGSNTGVFVGVCFNDYHTENLLNQKVVDPYDGTGNASTILANRPSFYFDMTGPSLSVDTACSSSLVALHIAMQSLKAGECDMAFVNGVNLLLSSWHYRYFCSIDALSHTGRCYTFDAAADGYVPGEGIVSVLIKPLEKAKRDGDRIYAVIKGSAISHGGYTPSITAPSVTGETEVILRAWKNAGIDPENIGYIEAHGTGTKLGDPIEIQALKKAFENYSVKEENCAIGSVKAHIGHGEGAAGLSALVKVVLSMKNKMIPAMPQFKTLNPLIKLEGSPLYINRENKHWEKKGSAPRLAGISSFGFGGAYAHVVVEEWPDQLSYNGTGSDNIGFALIPLSAKKADRLKEYSKDLLHYLKKSRDILKTPIPISSLAYSLQVGREAMDFRAVFIVNSTDELIDKLEDYIEGKPNINNVLSGQVRDDNKTINLFKEDEFLNEAVRKWIEHNYVEKLAELWVMGGNIDWNLFYMHGTKPLRISLPTYSFAKESYWVSDVDTAKQNKPADINLCKSHESEMIKIQSKSNVHETQAKEALQEVMEVNLELLIERDLKKIVQEILKVSQDQLDNDTYLAEFGFDSISLSIFSKKLSELYQLNITPATLFGCPTIGNLINYLLNEHLSVVEEFYKIGKTKETEGVGQSANSNLASEKPNFGEIEAATDEPVAIIGISCKFPGAENCEEFWSNLLEGRDSITEIPLERWDWQKIYEKLEKNKKRTSIKWGGFINGAGDFDPEFFGISQEEAMLMDPNQRMMLMHAYMAIEDAGYDPESLAGSNTGVFIGVGNSDYNSLFNIMGMNSVATNMLSSMGPNRISYFLDLHGPSEPVENACASALIAIRHAVMSINSGKCNMAIVGGVNTVLTPAGHIDMGANGLLSVNGKCKPFSEDADGFVRSEGVGILVLKKLSSARKDGDHIYGLVCGGSENHGGRSNFLMAPNPVSQAAVLEKAYQEAGIDPSTVTYIEAHGTGTLLGDNIEMDSLKNAFKKLYNTTGEAASDKWTTKCCGVGSVKSNIGHTEVASGMAGVIKVLMQMKHKVLVPTINCGEMNPYIQLEDTPFYIVKEKQEWKPLLDASGKAMPRRAGVNAFGLGGVNAHIILEEYIQPQKMVSDVGARPHLVIFSAKNQERLQKVVRKMIEFVKSKSDICMEDLAYTLQVGRAQQETRLAMVAGTTEELLAGLRKYLNPEESSDVKLITMKNLNTEYSKIIDSFSGHKKEALLREIIAANDLEKLGVYWVQGNSVSWSSFNANNKARRISLPTYPFMKQHCWIKALSKLPQYMQTKDEGISEFQVSNDECFAISGCVIQRQDEKNYKHSELYKSWF